MTLWLRSRYPVKTSSMLSEGWPQTRDGIVTHIAPVRVAPAPVSTRRRHSAAVLTAAGLATFLGSVGLAAAPAAAAPAAPSTPVAPDAIVGDPHSPAVARLATLALDGWAVYERSGAAADREQFDAALAAAATATAGELGVSAPSVQQAWAAADEAHRVAFLSALTQLGVEYQSNTSEPFVGFDCSGLTTYAWSEAGVQLSRQSGSQIDDAAARTPETAMAGDLVQYPGHVMMYLGVPDAVVHSANQQSDVEIWMLSDHSVRYGDPTA